MFSNSFFIASRRRSIRWFNSSAPHSQGSTRQNAAFCLVLPWLCGAEELNHLIERLREAMKKEFENKCYLLDFEPMFLTKKHRMEWFIWDGVHPKAETYEALGIFASPLLETWIKEK